MWSCKCPTRVIHHTVDQADRMTKTIHFEGIAGSGKSTASERLCDILKSKGVDAAWWLEESADHPVMPVELRALSKNKDFSKIWLDAWQSFLTSQSQAVSIFDGYAFQSTVRFLFEQRVHRSKIDSYFQHWQDLAPDTSITYLFVKSPVDHYEIVFPERGVDWTKKLFTWVERTPLGKALHLNGKSGFVEFWSVYQELCLELLDSAYIETEIIEARSWDDKDLEDLAIRRGLY